METLKPLLLIVLLLEFYPLPVALIVSALVRLGLGWTRARGLTALSGMLALPNAYLVLFGERGLFAASENQILVTGAAALTLAGLGIWIFTLGRRALGQFWLEPLVVVGASGYLVLAVSNWIAH